MWLTRFGVLSNHVYMLKRGNPFCELSDATTPPSTSILDPPRPLGASESS